MRITAIVWSSHAQAIEKGASSLPFIEMTMFASKEIARNEDLLKEAFRDAEGADLVLLYRSADVFWNEVEAHFKENRPENIACLSHDPSYWTLSSVSPSVLQRCMDYLRMGGEENAGRMLRFLASETKKADCEVLPPYEYPWQGIYHPAAPVSYYESNLTYLGWYGSYAENKGIAAAPAVGVLFSRHYWVNGQAELENKLIYALEDAGMRVIPVFSNGTKDNETGSIGSGAAAELFFTEGGKVLIGAFVKLQTFYLNYTRGSQLADTGNAKGGVELLKMLNVPVFQPFVSSYKTTDEWMNDPLGAGSDVAWSVAMPEFEGVIEPFIIGALKKDESGIINDREPIPSRCAELAARVSERVKLRNVPAGEKKIVFMLHNAPCSSVEATVGSGAGLDCPESVVRLMRLMSEHGYNINRIPENGEELAQEILAKKAISEFRWTTVNEIVNKGGTLALVENDKYLEWWDELPEKVKNRMAESWGNPPGEAVGGMPPAMVYDGKIAVTGLDFGNVLVCVQPKRGCAGARCDGEVCKILHDPDVPPPHQYLATYRWIEKVYGAHAVIHVGTHGTLEFLPGKGVGLSGECLPEIVINKLPHLYIYNADNSPEGIIAKRRSYATLVNHMQSPMMQGGLYGDYEELDRTIGEWEQAKNNDPGRAHMIEHLITGLLEKMKMQDELGFEDFNAAPFAEVKEAAHNMLSRMRNTWVQDGMHIYGFLPETEEKEAGYVYGILRYDSGDDINPRRLAASLLGFELEYMLANQKLTDTESGKSFGALLEKVEQKALELVELYLSGGSEPELTEDLSARFRSRVTDLRNRLRESREDLALMNAADGGYTPAGASGLIYRGKDDVLPTGRNMFSLDPESVPTKAAAVLGNALAVKLVEKYLNEEGRLPENVAIYWMCADIMWSDGEGMAQIMSLLGVRPVWKRNGRVHDFEIIPISELGRPRIDVTIRVSGITRDNFPDRIALVDRAVQAVAALDEPVELNYVRKHTLASLASDGIEKQDKDAFRKAARRVFSAAPGSYRAGVNLAVYASAWKEAGDLADIFVAWNGFAYGDGYGGEPAFKELARSLATVDVTFNKIMDDSHDLLGCCGYFGSHGGLSVASSHIKGEKVRNYYGDTREKSSVEVRTLADELRRIARTKLLNPKWIEGMKRHGYKGAGDISKRVGRLYGWEASTGEVDDKIFDDITRAFVEDRENRDFFEKHNPWALEEMARRLLEAEKRGLWNAEPELLETLKDTYLDIEGWIEERTGDIEGEFQGGTIDIIGADDVQGWKDKIDGIRKTVASIREGR